jgi:hypothetical protein
VRKRRNLGDAIEGDWSEVLGPVAAPQVMPAIRGHGTRRMRAVRGLGTRMVRVVRRGLVTVPVVVGSGRVMRWMSGRMRIGQGRVGVDIFDLMGHTGRRRCIKAR